MGDGRMHVFRTQKSLSGWMDCLFERCTCIRLWHPTDDNAMLVLLVFMLAYMGHYSIDTIIGWYVAVYVSAPAERLGRYYSRQGASVENLMPKTPREAFEYATGVANTRLERRMSALLTRPEVQEALAKMESEDSDVHSQTTARILQETTSKMMQEQAQMLQEELQHLQTQATQAVQALREQRLRESASKKSSMQNTNSRAISEKGKKAR
jgi:hypothetical protein